MASYGVLSLYKDEIVVLSSRFIGLVFPLESKDEVDSCLKKAHGDYPKATHYCYAVRYDGYEYCNDDGEPSRSAGLPILGALKSENLNRTILIVVRYFGGQKLGLPRLTKSYKDIAKITAKMAQKIEFLPGIKAKICLDYASFEYWKRTAERSGFAIIDPKFEEKVTFFASGSDKILLPLVNSLREEEVLTIEKTEIKRRLADDSSK